MRGLVKQTKNIENIDNTKSIEEINKKLSKLKKDWDDMFDDHFCGIFKKLVSKNPKPSRYLYIPIKWEICLDGTYEDFCDDDYFFTSEEKMDSTAAVFTSRTNIVCETSKDSKLRCSILRVPLYKIDIDYMKKCLNCDSIKMFLKRYVDKHRSYGTEDFYWTSGFRIVHRCDDELYIGFEETMLETLVFKIERCEHDCPPWFDKR